MAAQIQVASCNCARFGCADGGMLFDEVGLASGREEVTLAAGTICTNRRRSGPNPRTRGEAGRLEGLPTLPEEEPQGSLCCPGWRWGGGADEFRDSQHGSLRQCQPQLPSSPPYFVLFFFLDFKNFRFLKKLLLPFLFLMWGSFDYFFLFLSKSLSWLWPPTPLSLSPFSGHRHTFPETDIHRHADTAP